ncbi:MAG TPA: HAD-IC family P-type ATPase, partial [Oligoflexia bacterium]|nr:HAD-IC family P-type ATPase [Oligoflexia bacterium]
MGLNVVAASKPAVPEIPPELESSGKATLAIGGMWCTSCAKAVEAMFAKQPGVKQASVSFASETARVHWDTGRTVLSRIIEPVLKLGYGISPVTRADAQYQNIKREVDDLKKRLVWAAGGAGWTMLVSLVDHWPGRMTALEPEVRTGVFLSAGAACILVIFYSGLPFLRAGMRTLKAGVPGMDFLISAGALSAAALSFWNLFRGAGHLYFDAAAMLIAFLLGGRIIEHAARRKSRSTLQTLLAEAPARASVLTGDGKEARRAVEEIRCGERIRIRPGERISLDGIVRQGESAVDNSLITGESRPVDVGPGIRVLAGAINTDGELIVEVEQEKGERRIDHISRKMGEILAEKAPYETLSAELAQKLVPVVFGVSLLSAVWAIFGGSTTEEAIVRAVSVLVITCPCALGLATPMALMVALGEGAKFGLVFRDGETIEKLALVNEIYFDKTGTLTEGKPAVAALLPAQGVSEEELLEAAALAESGSEHPIAHAVLKRWGKERVNQGTVRAFAGKGVEWSGQNGDIILAGS